MQKPEGYDRAVELAEIAESCRKGGLYESDLERLAAALLYAHEHRRTEGFVEACELCGTPRMYGNGQRGSIDGCDGQEDPTGERGIIPCPIKRGGEGA